MSKPQKNRTHSLDTRILYNLHLSNNFPVSNHSHFRSNDVSYVDKHVYVISIISLLFYTICIIQMPE